MNKIIIPITVCAFSTISLAKIVAFIPSNSSSYNSEPTIVDTTVRCAAGTGISRADLIVKIDGNEDVTGVCTSDITDFSELFSYHRTGANQALMTNINQDISNWDVSKNNTFESDSSATKAGWKASVTTVSP